MAITFQGTLAAPTGRFAVIAARFNQNVVEKLVEGALEGFKQHDIHDEAVDLVWVPGSFEIPLVAQRLATSRKYLAVVCLGAVIRGETDHYEYVAKAAAEGVAQAGLSAGIPVIFGVLTCATEQLALDRAGGKEGNKGFEAAVAAIEMVNLLKQLP
jgi:6,7-dimethyl-8-ribityllumazine synthase